MTMNTRPDGLNLINFAEGLFLGPVEGGMSFTTHFSDEIKKGSLNYFSGPGCSIVVVDPKSEGREEERTMYLSGKRGLQELELQKAGALVGTRSDMEAKGLKFMGGIYTATKAGYHTPWACEAMGAPIGPDESPEYCALMTKCPVDLCVVDEEGNRVLPCLPVYYRGEVKGRSFDLETTD